MNHPILLSPPETGTAERDALVAAVDSGWLAPVGPALDAFEQEMAATVGRAWGVGLSSGTAALHLALLVHGVGPGDDVLVSTFTFAATVNAIAYTGATPVLIDSESSSWNLSPDLLAEELHARRHRPPKAAVVVDLYGQCADQSRIVPLLAEHGVLHVVDAAESLGATCADQPSAAYGDVAVLSFNGNKIITTTGGGMLMTDEEAVASRVRHLATQAREKAAHYEHVEIGYNYRLSNLLAAFGSAQLADLERRVERRREIFERYASGLAPVAGLELMPEAPYGRANRWLTCITLDEAVAGVSPDDLRLHLESAAIEARPTWKPMHQQPVFAHCPSRLDGTSDRLFRTGLCLPSGSSLSHADQDRVIATILERAEAHR